MGKAKIKILCYHCNKNYFIFIPQSLNSYNFKCPYCDGELYAQLYDLEYTLSHPLPLKEE